MWIFTIAASRASTEYACGMRARLVVDNSHNKGKEGRRGGCDGYYSAAYAYGLLATRHLIYGPASGLGDYSRVYRRRPPFTLLVL